MTRSARTPAGSRSPSWSGWSTAPGRTWWWASAAARCSTPRSWAGCSATRSRGRSRGCGAGRPAAAATGAGRAVDSTRVGALQAYAGWLSTHRQVPHGVACLLTLTWLLPYNCRHLADDCADERGPAFVAERLQAVCTVLAGPA